MKKVQSGMLALLLLCGFISCQKDIASEEISQASSKAKLSSTLATQSLPGSSVEGDCPECVTSFAASEETALTNAVLALTNGSNPALTNSKIIKTIPTTIKTYNLEKTNVKVTVSHDLSNVYFTLERTDGTGFGNIQFKSPAVTPIDKEYKGNTGVPDGTKKIQVVSSRNSLPACSTVSFAFAVGGGGKDSHVSSDVLTYILHDLCPPACVINLGDYRTQTRGHWRNNNGQAYLTAHPELFNFTIGDGSNTKGFATPASIKAYLESGVANGTPGVLPDGGTFAAQVLTLAINVKADGMVGDFSKAEGKLASLVVAISDADIVAHPTWASLVDWNGKSVAEILTIAQKVLGGTSNAHSPSHMNELVTAINENFDNGTVDNGLLSCGK